jgi:perosamine synthetase
MFDNVIKFIRDIYATNERIPLHVPRFIGNEAKYLNDCIASTFVSSVGPYVDTFERLCAEYTKAKRAVVVVNGTEALHLALILAGVKPLQEVITQPLTFIATVNAIAYTGASPLFIDVDKETMGLSPSKMESFLFENAEIRDDGFTYNKKTGNKIAACIPMHTLGHPVKMKELQQLCASYNILLIEDAAESIGSKYGTKHTGIMGKMGVLSFNGNKIITTGGGGMLLTNDEELGNRAKHLSTQAKLPHAWEFVHDAVGYNFRMPNINAALGCAQIEKLDFFIERKRWLAHQYKEFFNKTGIAFFNEPEGCTSNFWLNAIVLSNFEERDAFLRKTNIQNIMTRPLWELMVDLPMYKHCQRDDAVSARWLQERVVNIPSSVPL